MMSLLGNLPVLLKSSLEGWQCIKSTSGLLPDVGLTEHVGVMPRTHLLNQSFLERMLRFA